MRDKIFFVLMLLLVVFLQFCNQSNHQKDALTLLYEVEEEAFITNSENVPILADPGFSSEIAPPPLPTLTKSLPELGSGRKDVLVPELCIPADVPNS